MIYGAVELADSVSVHSVQTSEDEEELVELAESVEEVTYGAVELADSVLVHSVQTSEDEEDVAVDTQVFA